MDRKSGFFDQPGVCPVCESDIGFRAHGFPLRNSFICLNCSCSPRERALVYVLEEFFPQWRTVTIHESSPGNMPSSRKLRSECPDYLETQFDVTVPLGGIHPTLGYRCEDLERQTFADDTFDLVITQDVFEHIVNPDLAIREIARTLRPGGAHLCTVPIVRKHEPSLRRADLIDGTIRHILPPLYHESPVSIDGSLVSIDWGFDIAAYFSTHGGLVVTIVHIEDWERGIYAELNEVLVCQKLCAPIL